MSKANYSVSTTEGNLYIAERSAQDKPDRPIGTIATDYRLRSGMKNINHMKIKSGSGSIGKVHLWRRSDIVTVTKGMTARPVAAYTKKGEFVEGRDTVDYKILKKEDILSDHPDFEGYGLQHGFSLGDDSGLDAVYCFEQEGQLSGLIVGEQSRDTALKGLCLVLARYVETQDYVFEFMDMKR